MCFSFVSKQLAPCCSVESSYHENHEKHPTSTPSPFAMAANVFDTSRSFSPIVTAMDWDQCSRPRALGIRSTASQPGVTGAVTGQRGERGAASVARASATKMLHLLERMKRNMSSSAMEICSYKLYQFIIVGTKKINHPCVYGYHPFMVMGMVYCCFNHIKQLSYYKFLHPI